VIPSRGWAYHALNRIQRCRQFDDGSSASLGQAWSLNPCHETMHVRLPSSPAGGTPLVVIQELLFCRRQTSPVAPVGTPMAGHDPLGMLTPRGC
jgi:hypothetical protein